MKVLATALVVLALAAPAFAFDEFHNPAPNGNRYGPNKVGLSVFLWCYRSTDAGGGYCNGYLVNGSHRSFRLVEVVVRLVLSSGERLAEGTALVSDVGPGDQVQFHTIVGDFSDFGSADKVDVLIKY